MGIGCCNAELATRCGSPCQQQQNPLPSCHWHEAGKQTRQGNCAFTNFKRPAKELIERFRDIPLANIADNMGRTPCIDQQMKNYGGSNRLLGTAFTVKVPAGDNLLFHMALDMIQPGDVLVIDGNGCMERSQCGEIMTTYGQIYYTFPYWQCGCPKRLWKLWRSTSALRLPKQ